MVQPITTSSTLSMHNTTPIIVSIEGNIGSGKSTLLERLRAEFKDNKYKIVKNAISKELTNFIYKYFLLKRNAVSFYLNLQAYCEKDFDRKEPSEFVFLFYSQPLFHLLKI